MGVAYAGENLKCRKRAIEALYHETGGMNTEIKDALTLFFVFSLSIIEEYSAQILAKYVISDKFQHDLYEYLDSEMTQAHREDLLNRCGFLNNSTLGHIGNIRGIWKTLVRNPHAPIDWKEDQLPSKMEVAIDVTEELYEWLIFTNRVERAAREATRLEGILEEELAENQEQLEEKQDSEIVLQASTATVRTEGNPATLILGPTPRLQEQKENIEGRYAEEKEMTGDIVDQLRVFFVYSYGMIEEHSAQLIQRHLIASRFHEETRGYVHQTMSQTHREKLLSRSGIFQNSEEQDTIIDDIGQISRLRHKLAHQPTDPIRWEEDNVQPAMETAIDVSNRLVDALKDDSILEEILSEEDAYL